MLRHFAALGLALLATSSTYASSDDAWSEFAAAVEQGCLAATTGFFTDARAVIDPFGSESYGLAIVTGETPAGTTASIICVFDKQTEVVEIGGELNAVVTASETAE